MPRLFQSYFPQPCLEHLIIQAGTDQARLAILDAPPGREQEEELYRLASCLGSFVRGKLLAPSLARGLLYTTMGEFMWDASPPHLDKVEEIALRALMDWPQAPPLNKRGIDIVRQYQRRIAAREKSRLLDIRDPPAALERKATAENRDRRELCLADEANPPADGGEGDA